MSRTVVISGASSGIGLATAKKLSSLGYQVIGLSRQMPKEVIAFDYFLCDLADETSIQKATQKILEQYPTIDALINCAGMGISGAIEYTTIQEVKRIIDVNIIGSYLLSNAFIPTLRKTKGSRIINISSVAGELTVPFQTFYSMTKAAMNAYTEGLRMELKPFGVHVSAVLPGDTKTSFTANRQKSPIEVDPIYQDRIKRSIERMEHDEQHGHDPLKVTAVVLKILKRKNPPVFVTVGVKYKVFVFLKRFFPKRLLNWIMYVMYAK
jgi:short-subunit dehydrogenase